jgi:hypothetical protein
MDILTLLVLAFGFSGLGLVLFVYFTHVADSD